METIYLVSLLVGGFFVLLSLLGGHHDSDTDTDLGADSDYDAHLELDAHTDIDADTDLDVHDGEVGVAHSDGHVDLPGAGPGLIDLLTIRALFLFAAFFGLTGMLLSWIDTGEPYAAIVSVLTGLVVGLGGNYLIKRVGYEHVSSNVTSADLSGRTGKVVIPFEGAERGKIRLEAKGHRLQLIARPFGGDLGDAFQAGDEVVIVRMEKGIAEVVKPG